MLALVLIALSTLGIALLRPSSQYLGQALFNVAAGAGLATLALTRKTLAQALAVAGLSLGLILGIAALGWITYDSAGLVARMIAFAVLIHVGRKAVSAER